MLSKVIAVLAFILAAVISFYFFSYIKKPTISKQNPVIPIPSNEINNPNEVVSSFYNGYKDCLKNPPEEAKDRVSEYCQNNSNFTTAEFKQNLENEGAAKAGADPVFCAQNIPEDMQFNTSTQDSSAQSLVTETFGTIKLNIPVTLKLENNEWKVDNIICPRPS